MNSLLSISKTSKAFLGVNLSYKLHEMGAILFHTFNNVQRMSKLLSNTFNSRKFLPKIAFTVCGPLQLKSAIRYTDRPTFNMKLIVNDKKLCALYFRLMFYFISHLNIIFQLQYSKINI